MIESNANTQIYRTLLKSFKESIGFDDHQIKSFNEFLHYRIQKIFNDIGEIELETPDLAEFKIRLGKVRVPNPTIKEADGAVRKVTPNECRLRSLTYASPIYLEMIPIINGVEQESQEVKIGDLPMMVKSDMCMIAKLTGDELVEAGEDPNDPGGYFIINGTERVIVMMEEVLSNMPVIEKKNDIETARINSESAGFVQRHVVERKGGIVTLSFANIKKMPVVVILRALGMETDKNIIESISSNPEEMQEIYFNLYETNVKTIEDAREFVGRQIKIPQKEYRNKRINDLLDKYLLPHLGQKKANREAKATYLAKVVRKVIKLGLGNVEEQDIDHYGNKRLRMVADFFEILFRSVLLGKYGLVSRIVYSYQKLVKRGKMPSIQSIVESEYLTKRIISHMATGQWVGGRTGVCQRLERTNFVRTIAHLRNVISPLSSSQEHFEARALHATHWGRLCAEETPEGINIGLRKYLAVFANITTHTDVKDKKLIESLVNKNEGTNAIFMDGHIIGTTNSPKKLVTEIITRRRKGNISNTVNVSWVPEFEEIHINTDSGRVQRPLIILENGKQTLTEEFVQKIKKNEMTWNDLISHGVIEYLDAEEENSALIAIDDKTVTSDYTHIELNPGIILGLSASLVPFPTHNRGDRVNFGAKMSGQSLGIYATNFLARTDTKSDVLLYPQMPLVNTAVGGEIEMEKHPQGANIVIAIMSFKGYNMEDGIILNKATIERGFGHSYFFRNYSTEEMRYWGIEKDEIKIPDKSVSGYRTEESYANLAEDGIVNRETAVQAGDVLVGKVSPLRFFGPMESFMVETENKRETSETIRYGEDGVVDNVILSETSNGNKLVKINVRSRRLPELGDKFASRHGQKGVISLVVPEEDMPFTSSGITPDIILNPHAIPSRMTIGQLMEIIAAKLSALSGKAIDASAFNEISEMSIRDGLKKFGFKNDGKEIMYDGLSGKKLEADILIGPCYYQKLHHMVANKVQSRARGPVTLLTKQPTAGRVKQGGLRLGEMEKDCLIAHGASLLLKERFSSDNYIMPVCTRCGLFAVEDRVKGKKYCMTCKKSKIEEITISYAFKLMLDELKCLGIYPKVNIK
jgi:DNA-directed RNA polymerase subunit B